MNIRKLLFYCVAMATWTVAFNGCLQPAVTVVQHATVSARGDGIPMTVYAAGVAFLFSW